MVGWLLLLWWWWLCIDPGSCLSLSWQRKTRPSPERPLGNGWDIGIAAIGQADRRFTAINECLGSGYGVQYEALPK